MHHEYQLSLAARFSLRRTVRHLVLQAKRPRIAAAICVVILVLGCLTYLAVRRYERVRWAREVALPEVARLVEKDDHIGALALAEKAERYLKGDPTLDGLTARTSQPLTVKTTPDGADVWFRPYSNPLVAERYLGRSPIARVRLPLGPYWLRVEKDGYDTMRDFYFGQGFGAPGTVEAQSLTLAPKGTIPPGMVPIPDDWFILQVYGLPKTTIEKFSAFLVDDHEVTNREFERFVAAGGCEKPEYWEHPFFQNGRTLGFRDAMAAFVDTTGRPRPATWEAGVSSWAVGGPNRTTCTSTPMPGRHSSVLQPTGSDACSTSGNPHAPYGRSSWVRRGLHLVVRLGAAAL